MSQQSQKQRAADATAKNQAIGRGQKKVDTAGSKMPDAGYREPMTLSSKWDEEADVVVVGYGFAGSAAAIAAHDAGAKVLILEKAPEEDKGGNSRVDAQILFWPNDIEKAKTYFKALTGPYMDNISDEMVQVWATEMHANRAYLENLGMRPVVVESRRVPGTSRLRLRADAGAQRLQGRTER